MFMDLHWFGKFSSQWNKKLFKFLTNLAFVNCYKCLTKTLLQHHKNYRQNKKAELLLRIEMNIKLNGLLKKKKVSALTHREMVLKRAKDLFIIKHVFVINDVHIR